MRLLVLPVAMLAAGLLQAMGFTGTCTGGDGAAFFVGAIISVPCFAVILGLSWATLAARSVRHPRLDMAAYVVAAGLAALLLAFNASLLRVILVDGNTACGPDHGAAGREDYLIAFSYGALPLIAIAMAIWALGKLAGGRNTPA